MWVSWLHQLLVTVSYLKQMSISYFVEPTFLMHVRQKTNESERLHKLLPFVCGNKMQIFLEINCSANKRNERDLIAVDCSIILLGFKYPELKAGSFIDRQTDRQIERIGIILKKRPFASLLWFGEECLNKIYRLQCTQ